MAISHRVCLGIMVLLLAALSRLFDATAASEAEEWKLDAEQPELMLSVPDDAWRSATVVLIPIHQIRSSGGRAFSIIGHLEFHLTPESPQVQTIPLGLFTVLPPGQPGRYLLPGTGLRSMPLPRAPTAIRLILRLQPIHAQDIAPDLIVVIGAPQWLQGTSTPP